MKLKTSKTDTFSMFLFCSALLMIFIVLLNLVIRAPEHPLVGIMAIVALIGVLWFVVGLTLK
jgi:hypothetical protein